ncbi:MAG: flagellar motor switch protein FliM [Clostridiales bacterium]|jgi:flagellar motor switch protein FliM|nr:flagellar motor switch protein FliM [Clostridiales bacterium]
MADVLSQSEIDRLLNAIGEGDASNIAVRSSAKEKPVKDYDFTRPSKFNKDQLRSLEIIFDNFARLVSSFLTAYLRSPCIIDVASSEQVTFKEFSNSIANPSILCILGLQPLKGYILVELSPKIGYAIIDRVLGGTGRSLKKIRDFSEIEKILLDRILSKMFRYIVEPLENVVKVTTVLERIETNAQLVQSIAPSETIALITLTIVIGDAEGFFTFCIPYNVVEPVIENLSAKRWFRQNISEEKGEESRTELASRLEKTYVTVSAILGKTTIMVNDFVNLRVGDIMPLDSYANSYLNVMVGDLLKFKGAPGVNRGRNAIQIVMTLDEKEE